MPPKRKPGRPRKSSRRRSSTRKSSRRRSSARKSSRRKSSKRKSSRRKNSTRKSSSKRGAKVPVGADSDVVKLLGRIKKNLSEEKKLVVDAAKEVAVQAKGLGSAASKLDQVAKMVSLRDELTKEAEDVKERRVKQLRAVIDLKGEFNLFVKKYKTSESSRPSYESDRSDVAPTYKGFKKQLKDRLTGDALSAAKGDPLKPLNKLLARMIQSSTSAANAVSSLNKLEKSIKNEIKKLDQFLVKNSAKTQNIKTALSKVNSARGGLFSSDDVKALGEALKGLKKAVTSSVTEGFTVTGLRTKGLGEDDL